MRGARSSACPLCRRGRSLALSHPVIVGFSREEEAAPGLIPTAKQEVPMGGFCC